MGRYILSGLHNPLEGVDELVMRVSLYCADMGEAAKRLYIRLFQRRGPWFRVSTLSYPEIDLDGALNVSTGMVMAAVSQG